MDVDIVPMREFARDDLRRLTGSLANKFSTVWSEKTTPQPKVAPGRIALEYFDLVGGIAQLHRDREIEAGRPAADARDLHAMTLAKVTKARGERARALSARGKCGHLTRELIS